MDIVDSLFGRDQLLLGNLYSSLFQDTMFSDHSSSSSGSSNSTTTTSPVDLMFPIQDSSDHFSINGAHPAVWGWGQYQSPPIWDSYNSFSQLSITPDTNPTPSSPTYQSTSQQSLLSIHTDLFFQQNQLSVMPAQYQQYPLESYSLPMETEDVLMDFQGALTDFVYAPLDPQDVSESPDVSVEVISRSSVAFDARPNLNHVYHVVSACIESGRPGISFVSASIISRILTYGHYGLSQAYKKSPPGVDEN